VEKNLVLLGMMAVGKTTLGKIVAKNQKLEFIDIDSNIEKKNSMTIVEIFEKKGEKFFREEEQKEVLESMKKKNCVIALGGGAFVNKIIRENVLKNAISIWLTLDIETLIKRTQWNEQRPLLNKVSNKKRLNELFEERKNFYKLANHKIVCDELSRNDIVEKIMTLYAKY
tara:strand:- start:649 stop:1158 length:510 start_codon:yes stop_codon:yes gene_type:complete